MHVAAGRACRASDTTRMSPQSVAAPVISGVAYVSIMSECRGSRQYAPNTTATLFPPMRTELVRP
ncbi:MAG: hypothetical protein QOD59_392 [Mycobacterium sp.]|jgi:hypothetical protein|nr:hypothetical protein [Mycobacterium sp.]MDT7790956.1 hypothetical protein [Mycobacterium sp.]